MRTKILEINNKKIICNYIKRRNSKKIKIRVNNKSIVNISLPYYCTYFEAKLFVNKNRAWILDNVNRSEKNNNNFYYLGENISIQKKYITNNISFNYILHDNQLTLFTNNPDDSDELLFSKWLKIKAEEYIPNRVNLFAKKYSFNYNNIKIKNLMSRWGSCSSKRNLSFNQKLMCFNTNVIDYVIVHELCHLKQMNHSQKFWNLVSEIIPNYKQLRKELNNKQI
ncbi:MAG: hypothetical protein CR986_02850 [Ignavibacteriae bacterium]|nr:MAG: hypothetical protein CR986_02850 [Ignavibacteriota bacterium]